MDNNIDKIIEHCDENEFHKLMYKKASLSIRLDKGEVQSVRLNVGGIDYYFHNTGWAKIIRKEDRVIVPYDGYGYAL